MRFPNLSVDMLKEKREMTAIRAIAAVCLLPIIAAFFGCTPVTGYSTARLELQRQLAPLKIKPVVSFSLGAFSMGCIRKLADMAEDNDIAAYLEDVSGATVDIYEVPEREGELPVARISDVADRLREKNWEILAKVRDGSELALILYRLEKQQLVSVFVAALDRSDLILVEIEGNLNRVIQKAMQREAFGIHHHLRRHLSGEAV